MDDSKPSEMFADEQICTPAQAAEVLTVTPRTLAHWRQTGRGPAYLRIGPGVRYLRSDLLAWAATQRIEPGVA